jgi:hypothetical protein
MMGCVHPTPATFSGHQTLSRSLSKLGTSNLVTQIEGILQSIRKTINLEKETTRSWSGQMLHPSYVSGNLSIGVKRVNAFRHIWLVMISESYCLTCNYSWISGQSALSFMIGSIINRLALKVWSPVPLKTISVSALRDDQWSFVQITISVSDQRKGLTFDHTYGQRTNV